jgi:hypothetical protein
MVNTGDKKREKPLFFSGVLIAFSSLLIFIYGCGTSHFIRSKTDINNVKRVAVLPFENFTSDEYAGEKIRRLVIT